MSTVWENISDVVARIAQWLGIKPSESKRLEALRAKLTTSKATNVDQRETLKDEIRKLEARAKQKKKEFDGASGDIKRMVGREIEGIFRDLDRLRGRENIITGNLDRISVAVAKIDELIVAKAKGVEEGQLDDLALELQDVFADLKESDRATRDLEQERYEAPTSEPVNVEQRMADLEGTEPQVDEISEETKKRLAELVDEKD